MRIETGAYEADYTNAPNWGLNQGAGPRTFISPRISFSQPFNAVPRMMIGIVALDTDYHHNTRVNSHVVGVDSEGFNVGFETWADTLLNAVGVNWVAIGD